MDVEDCDVVTPVCSDCSAVMKSTGYKRCYPCNYILKHGGCGVPEKMCECGVACKTFKRCYQCHVTNTIVTTTI